MFGRLFFRFLLFGLVALIVWRAIGSFFSGIKAGFVPPAKSKPETRVQKGQMMARDPVCGTFVVPANAIAGRGKSGPVYFCSDKCRQAYESRS
jgi:YHS domain-containing protein